MLGVFVSFFEGTVLPSERCHFMLWQQYDNNIIWSLFIIFWNKNSKYFYKFILIEDSVLITATFVI